MTKRLRVLPLFLLVGWMGVAYSSRAECAPVVVGRLFYVENEVLRHVPEENDWVSLVKDAPVGPGDAVYSGSRGRAEFLVPNGTCIRIDNGTQIQFTTLAIDVTEADIFGGGARFHNRGAGTVLKANTPFGYVVSAPGAVFDVYAGENSVEVVPVKGRVTFVNASGTARYDAAAGSPSLLSDGNRVVPGQLGPHPSWGAWNRARDRFWAAKARAIARTSRYLPPVLRDEGYILDEHGRWEPVYYEGGDRWFWRPTRVPPGWSPFTAGRWTEWAGDQTWVPAEAFGYVTHHYGNWIFVGNRWYWAPPVSRVVAGRPLLDVGFAWYPGRVSWIHRGNHIGWVPLAPHETYYARHQWGGPRTKTVNNDAERVNVDVGSLAHAGHAVVVSRSSLYAVSNYSNVREPRMDPASLAAAYGAAPVLDNRAIGNYTAIKQRHSYTNTFVQEKPRADVSSRIRTNRNVNGRPVVTAASLWRQVKRLREGRIGQGPQTLRSGPSSGTLPPVRSGHAAGQIPGRQGHARNIPEPQAAQMLQIPRHDGRPSHRSHLPEPCLSHRESSRYRKRSARRGRNSQSPRKRVTPGEGHSHDPLPSCPGSLC